MAEIIANYGLYAAYILGALAVILVIVLPLVNAISNPKSLLGSAIGFVIIAVLFFIGWSISGNEVIPAYAESNITPASSKLIGGALITMYILGGLAIIAIVFSEVNKIFR